MEKDLRRVIPNQKKKKNNTIQVGMKMKKGKKVPDIRQIDHFFKMIQRIYMESKCNLNFDTEKIVASNKKVLELTKALKADKGVYLSLFLLIFLRKFVASTLRKVLIFGV